MQRVALAVAALVLAGAAPPDPRLYQDLHWRLLGPFRGGWATMVAGVADQPDTFYFAAAGGGLWHTIDAGRSWQPLFDHGPAASIGAVAIAPSNPATLYLGSGQPEPRYDIAAGRGVYKSTDGGVHWQDLGLHDTRYIGRIWVDPNDANTVLVAAQGHFFGPSADRGLYRSTDGGRSWAHVLKLGDWTGVVDIAADPHNPAVLFASAWEAHQYPWQSYFTPVGGGGSGIYKSTDRGVTWTRIAGGGWPSGPVGRISVAVSDVASGTRVYAAVDAEAKTKARGLYRSDDGGTRWTRVNDGDAFTDWYASRLTVAPDDPDTLYTVGQSIRRCTHGGATCTIIKGSPGGDDYHDIWINPAHPDHIITGSDQGAVVSVDRGATWSSWYNQPTGQFYHLAADNRFPYWVYSGQQDSGTVGIASRSDYGVLSFRDWHPVGGDERDDDIPDPTDPLIVYGSGLGGRVSRWDGHTGQVQNISPWPVSSYGKRPTLSRYHYLWVTPLAASRTGPAALYLGAQLVFRSTDGGRNWATISGDLTGKIAGAKNCGGNPTPQEAKACGYGAIAAIEPSPREAGTVWVGTDDGLIEVTHDLGGTWSNVTPAAVPLWAKVASLDVSAATAGSVYAAIDGHRLDDFQPHVLRSRDDGQSWQPITTGLPADHFVSVVRSDPVKPGLLYAGTDAGVFVSFDDGDHWAALQQNLPTAWVHDLLVHGDDLIAATEGRALWVLDDLSPLRQISADIAQQKVHLFVPADAVRVHANNNTDTPPPPETPLGQNPPAGAIIDYWLGATPHGPVVLEIRDAAGHVVRRFSSADHLAPAPAERYFAPAWTRPPIILASTPGMHRFVWSLRYDRPRTVNAAYSIAAIWGEDTPVVPLGPYALPGSYRVVLTVDGESVTAPLIVEQDPRVHTQTADLAASLALSQRIDGALALAWLGHGERAAVLHELDTAHDPAAHTVAAQLSAPLTPGELSFSAADAILGAIEGDLEAADVAPTAAQLAVVDRTIGQMQAAAQRWAAFKSTGLAALNASLTRGHHAPIVVPRPDQIATAVPDAGQDLP